MLIRPIDCGRRAGLCAGAQTPTARDRLLRGLILELAGVELLLGNVRQRRHRHHAARRRACFQYTALLGADGRD